ncbi:unnamed protein product [Pleuronectes platessa]|uniref:Uncharacterized protein n=1 Tax=Pleuronectes platessa TaxID=8262 RepID=A0A9N7YVR7_PLEPL|nr:unnamed protein product [Pleuronectes platessa]
MSLQGEAQHVTELNRHEVLPTAAVLKIQSRAAPIETQIGERFSELCTNLTPDGANLFSLGLRRLCA